MKKIRFCAAALALGIACSLAACGGTEGQEEPPNGEEEMKLDNLAENFWETDTMYDETVMLVAETDADGNIVSAPEGKLLFPVGEIVEVKQYFHQDNSGIVTFQEEEDFTIEENRIIAKGSIEENLFTGKKEFRTDMPFVTDRQVSGEDLFPGLATQDTGIPSTDAGLQLPYTETYHIVQMQISVTYKHAEGLWQKATPAYYGDTVLKRTADKLKAKEKVELFVFGDSISTGSNSSSVLNITPYLDTWPELTAKNLASYYGAEVNLTNKSMGGWTTMQAVSDTKSDGWVGGQLIQQYGIGKLLSDDMPDYKPDIALVGFGMNDATLGVDKNQFASNIRTIIDTIRARNPECDIILIGTMLANPKALNQNKDQMSYFTVLEMVAELYDGVAAVNVGQMHQDLLDSGKAYIDMTGNNVNHPNDFMARVYAMNMLSALIG